MSTQAPWEALSEPERYELYEQPRYQFDMGRRDFFKIVGGAPLYVSSWNAVGGPQPTTTILRAAMSGRKRVIALFNRKAIRKASSSSPTI